MSDTCGYDADWWKRDNAVAIERKRCKASSRKLARLGDAFLVVTEGVVTEPVWSEAVKHAGWVRKHHTGAGTPDPANPSTEVDLLAKLRLKPTSATGTWDGGASRCWFLVARYWFLHRPLRGLFMGDRFAGDSHEPATSNQKPATAVEKLDTNVKFSPYEDGLVGALNDSAPDHARKTI